MKTGTEGKNVKVKYNKFVYSQLLTELKNRADIKQGKNDRLN